MIEVNGKYYIASKEKDERKMRESIDLWRNEDIHLFLEKVLDDVIGNRNRNYVICEVNPETKGILNKYIGVFALVCSLGFSNDSAFWGHWYNVYGKIYVHYGDYEDIIERYDSWGIFLNALIGKD